MQQNQKRVNLRGQQQLSQQKIAFNSGISKKTVNKALKVTSEKNISWPLPASYTDAFLEGLLRPGKR